MTSDLYWIKCRNALAMGLTLFVSVLLAAAGSACGGGWGEGGDPLSLVAEDAYELQVYIPKTYLEQDLPEQLRDSFDGLAEDFDRFGIDLEEMDSVVLALVECCDYSRRSRGGARMYIVDGPIDPSAVKGKLENAGLEATQTGDYETWDKLGGIGDFRSIDRMAAVFLSDEGYLLIGDQQAVHETMFEIGRGPDKSGESPMERVIARLGEGWKESGRLNAQTNNTANAHCAPDVRYRSGCQATAYYTIYSEEPLRSEMAALYRTREDALQEVGVIEHNFESSGVFLPVDVDVVNDTTDGPVRGGDGAA